MLHFVGPNSSKAAFGSHWLYLEVSLLSAQPLDHPCVSWPCPVQLSFQPTQLAGSLTSTHLAITNTTLPCRFPVLPDPQDLLTFSCSKTQILVWKPPRRTQCHQAWSCCHPWFSLYAREQACTRAHTPTHSTTLSRWASSLAHEHGMLTPVLMLGFSNPTFHDPAEDFLPLLSISLEGQRFPSPASHTLSLTW